MSNEYLDISLIEPEYKYSENIIYAFRFILDGQITGIVVKNKDAGMAMFVSPASIYFRTLSPVNGQIHWETVFKYFELKKPPSKYFIGILVDWFMNIQHIPNGVPMFKTQVIKYVDKKKGKKK